MAGMENQTDPIPAPFLEKQTLRIAGITAVGNKLDDALEAAEKAVGEAAGFINGLKRAGEALAEVTKEIQAEIQAEKLDMEQGKAIIGWIVKIDTLLKSDFRSGKDAEKRAEGYRDAMKHAVGLASRSRNEETQKKPPQRPEPGVAQQRRAEDAETVLARAADAANATIKKQMAKKKAAKKKKAQKKTPVKEKSRRKKVD